MATVTRTLEIDRPLAEVRHYLSDFRTTTQWDPNTVSCERVDDGPLTVGAVFKNRQKMGPARMTLTYSLRVLEPERTELEGGNWLFRTRDEMRFSEVDGGGTRVTYTARVDARGPLNRLDGLLTRKMNQIADDAVRGMRLALEQLPVS